MAFDATHWPASPGSSDRGRMRARHCVKARLALAAVLLVSVIAGLGLVPAAPAGDPDLTRLIRAMAAIKAVLVAAAALAVIWRMRYRSAPAVFAAYAASLAAMGSGLGMMWTLSWPVASTVLLHGGFVALMVLAFRDRALLRVLEQRLQRLRSPHSQ